MQFIDLASQQQRILKKIETNIRAVLSHGKYILGPEIEVLEERLGTYVGIKHAIACASGTDALLLALMAHDVGPGDAVFTTPFTFVATAEAISLLGAVPAFVDIDPSTFNLDPLKLEAAVNALKTDQTTLQPKGVIPVDLFGLPADYDAITAIASEHGLFVIQDAAQSFGAEHKGEKACAQGNVGCTSFFPAKPLGCYGDGGMCFTNNDQIAETMESLRVHGQGRNKYENIRIGINGRLDTLQAAILLAKFDIFPEEVELRQRVAAEYGRLLSQAAGSLTIPTIPGGYRSAWAQYSLLTDSIARRSTIQDALKQAGIPTAVYYRRPLHLQPAFSSLKYKKGDFPVSEDCATRIFSLPMHPYLSAEDQTRIVDTIMRASGSLAR